MKLGINKIINRHWRDWAGLVYLFICLIDFFVAPLVWNLMMAEHCATHDCVAEGVTRWQPLTLCLLYTSPSPRDPKTSRMPSSA